MFLRIRFAWEHMTPMQNVTMQVLTSLTNLCDPVSSSLLLLGIPVVRDSPVVGPVHLVLPASLPLSQPAHQQALSAAGEGTPPGLHSLGRVPYPSTSSSNTHHLCLIAVKNPQKNTFS